MAIPWKLPRSEALVALNIASLEVADCFEEDEDT